jgi:hypothetical protein
MHLPRSGFPYPCLGQSQAVSRVLPIALDLIDNGCQDRGIPRASARARRWAAAMTSCSSGDIARV